jgi:hypothetical protein
LVTFGLQPPFNVAHMFSSWLNGVDKTIKHQILVGVCALCWALWLSQNNIVFDKTKGIIFYAGFIQGHILGSSHYHKGGESTVMAPHRGVYDQAGEQDYLRPPLFVFRPARLLESRLGRPFCSGKVHWTSPNFYRTEQSIFV